MLSKCLAVISIKVVLCLVSPAWADNLVVGVGLHAGQGKTASDIAKALLSSGQFNGFRDEVYWRRLERTRGSIILQKDLDGIDQLIDWGEDKVPALVILDYGNDFYDEGRQPYSDEGRSAFGRYAEYVAKRYSGKVFGFEIWNEWNIGFGNPKSSPRWGDPAAYVSLVKATAPIIRKNAPSAKVLCGAVADLDTAWVENILKLGVMAYCDGLSLHPYVFSRGSRGEPADAFAWVDEVHSLMQLYPDAAKKKIYITEIGWPNHSGKGGVDPPRSAAYLAQSLLIAKSKPFIGGLWWYELIDSGFAPEEREHNFGLVKGDLAIKPAFAVMRHLWPLLRAGIFLSKGMDNRGRQWMRFRLKDGDEVLAVWTRGNELKPIKFTGHCEFSSAAIALSEAAIQVSGGYEQIVGAMPLVLRNASSCRAEL